ncbi:MAG: hypothetical protein RI907_259 [Pseudomonadota bacterium]|jgi:2-keto-4-pentenoate hydratase
MTPAQRIEHLTQGLVAARQQRRLFTPDAGAQALTTAEAYAVQAGVAAAMGWFPNGPRAWKAGGASTVSGAPLPEVLRSPAVWHPASPPAADGGPSEWIVEAELAFEIAGGPAAPGQAPELGTVAVAIELIDTRLSTGLSSPSAWKLADQGVHGGLVLGEPRPASLVAHFSLDDWQAQAWSIDIHGQPQVQARGGLPAVSPMPAMAWLADHAAAHTGGLCPGDVVTTGAWGVVRARRGDLVTVKFAGVGEAQVTLA